MVAGPPIYEPVGPARHRALSSPINRPSPRGGPTDRTLRDLAPRLQRRTPSSFSKAQPGVIPVAGAEEVQIPGSIPDAGIGATTPDPTNPTDEAQAGMHHAVAEVRAYCHGREVRVNRVLGISFCWACGLSSPFRFVRPSGQTFLGGTRQ